ncbi:ATP dependent DNA ligase domain-domain-containing protein [Protomyces lactucae-debilis]|uniref:DNA ligase 4 n=1 Tax=Protomyces lactucae-debilis TaxID=2754530 RepID=A0A1Y2FQQ6_PROLT|nr:ATP dependent DNA ligase domain-containing protein [Protomyces lactucae-debilis]ORY86331.1 ATP dependent DNA ligase domain-domain-containing protein [Protomyces lactucae-debilis]
MPAKEVAAPPNRGETLRFSELVNELLQPVQQLSKTRASTLLAKPAERKREKVEGFIKKWKARVGPDMFPAMRLVMPEKDRDRIYRVKELTFANLLINVLGINKKSDDARSLTHWKHPSSTDAPAGDFPGCAYYVVAKRSTQMSDSTLTIKDVNDQLDLLAAAQKAAEQTPILRSLYEKMSALEFKWLVSIVLKAMKIGMSEKAIFPLIHPDAMQLYNLTSSLSRVCWQLHDSKLRLSERESLVRVFSCFQPQLAEWKSFSFEQIVKLMDGEPFWIEEKLDGERLQLHMKHGKFRYWSRGGNESTDIYGSQIIDGIGGGAITRHLQGVFHPKIKSIVLDGEVLAWDPIRMAPVPFGSLKGVAARESRSENSPDDPYPCFCVFDVLSVNDESVTHQPLRQRRAYLEKIITPKPHRFEILAIQETASADDIETRLRECVANASEGLLVKNPSRPYKLNDRSTSWIKVKPEYMSEFGTNLDLIVLGAYHGSGRRGSRLSSFLCGLRCDPQHGQQGPIRKFVSFCKVGGGFSSDDYRRIAHLTDKKWTPLDKKHPPDHIVFRKTNSGTILEAPDVWIRPEDSVVLQLKAASAETTTTFATAVTLRFPRFERLRDDRNWQNCVSEREFADLRDTAEGEKKEKEMQKHVRKNRAVATRKIQPMLLNANTGLAAVKVQDQALVGKTFFITADSRSLKISKKELEKIVVKHGGKVVQNDESNPDQSRLTSDVHCIGDIWSVKQSAIRNRGLVDIMTPQWLLDSIEAGHLLRKETRYMHFCTEATRISVERSTDQYGDSWDEHIDVSRLQLLLNQMEQDKALFSHMPTREELVSLQLDLDQQAVDRGDESWWIFAGCTVHLAKVAEDDTGPDYRSLLQVHGAKLELDVKSEEITHFIVSDSDDEQSRRLRSINALRSKIGHIVRADWVTQSLAEHTLLAESRFAV